ncbi:GNAT family N-acetyltransferase [Leifsonia sp. NPDC102414]|uniref:GNAT family N-acetyltransferase n=1 Tax=Leifsonia sp. NPDC102414 TaxID=3364124 RepID=UPI00380FF0DC
MDAFPEVFEVESRPGVVLRKLGLDDWAIELELARVPDVPTWTMYPADLTEEQARSRAARNVEGAEAGSGIRYVLVEDGVALGTAGFGRGEHGFEVFYALKQEDRGRGLVTAAVATLVAWLDAQGEPAAWLSTLDGNAASEAVAIRCGFAPYLAGTHTDGRPLTVWRRQQTKHP